VPVRTASLQHRRTAAGFPAHQHQAKPPRCPCSHRSGYCHQSGSSWPTLRLEHTYGRQRHWALGGWKGQRRLQDHFTTSAPIAFPRPRGHRSLLWVGHSSGWFIGSRVPGGTAVAPVHAVPRLPRPARARAPPRLDVHVCAPPMPPMRRHQPAGAVGCAARAWRATGSGFSGRGRGGA